MNEMNRNELSKEQFKNIAKCCCGYYTEPCDKQLVWCINPNNNNQLESNCQLNDCPIIETINNIFMCKTKVGL